MSILADEPLTLSREEQTTFNLERWAELQEDPEWEKWEGNLQTDKYGNVLMIPPPSVFHARGEVRLATLLESILRGTALTECPISTSKGVRSADVAWMPSKIYEMVKDEVCLPTAPPICVEIRSPGNSRREMMDKKALYFEAGATEVWFCDRDGAMTFFVNPEDAGSAESKFCAAFPTKIEV